jgi:hypothetical protein
MLDEVLGVLDILIIDFRVHRTTPEKVCAVLHRSTTPGA